MSRRSVPGVIACIWLLPALVGCDSAIPLVPSAPGIPATIFTVSGTVWVHTATGVEPGRGRSIVVSGPGLQTGEGIVVVDGDGRYQFRATQTGSLLIKSVDDYQPCITFASSVSHSRGEMTMDVHVVEDAAQLGANLPAALRSRAPLLSGRVFERTAEGISPVPHAQVELGGPDPLGVMGATTLTDDQGQYVVCNAIGSSVHASKSGYQTTQIDGLFSVDDGALITDKLDIELRPDLR